MQVCLGYEKLSPKKQLAKVDELLASFRRAEAAGMWQSSSPGYKRTIAFLEQARADAAARVGKAGKK